MACPPCRTCHKRRKPGWVTLILAPMPPGHVRPVKRSGADFWGSSPTAVRPAARKISCVVVGINLVVDEMSGTRAQKPAGTKGCGTHTHTQQTGCVRLNRTHMGAERLPKTANDCLDNGGHLRDTPTLGVVQADQVNAWGLVLYQGSHDVLNEGLPRSDPREGALHRGEALAHPSEGEETFVE